jgi:hypothetical protein
LLQIFQANTNALMIFGEENTILIVTHVFFLKMIDNQIPILVKYPFEGFLSHRVTPSHHPFIDGIFHL